MEGWVLDVKIASADSVDKGHKSNITRLGGRIHLRNWGVGLWNDGVFGKTLI